MPDTVTDWDVVRMMERFGGSFLQTLAQLYQRADPENQRRIKAAWPEYWAENAEIAVLIKARDAKAARG